MIKDKINENHPELSFFRTNNDSKQKLIEAAIEAWEDIPNHMLKKLLDLMPRRLTAVVAARGWYTKY